MTIWCRHRTSAICVFHLGFSLGGWRHSPALEGEIIGWLSGKANEEKALQPIQRKVLSDEDKMVWVHAKHLVDDHWKVSAFDIVFHGEDEDMPEFPEGNAARNPAMAVVRIVGSAGWLSPVGSGSARLT